MTESNQLADDLHYVRKVVEGGEKPGRNIAPQLIVWTLYSLICIPCYDFLPAYGGRINLAGWLIAAIISGIIGRREGIRSGQFDREYLVRTLLHWYGGVVLLMVAVFGVCWVNHGATELLASQFSVILVGFLYFTAGVHMQEVRFMRWAGPVIVLAGIGLALLPHYRWTAVGLIFAACLTAPLIFSRGAQSR